jgi:DNA-binding NtrC family response regulator
MQLLIVGALDTRFSAAIKLATDSGASVTHAESVEQALAVLRSGRSARGAADTAMGAEQAACKLAGRTLAEVERDLILQTLKYCLGNRTHAADMLGISIRTLRNKLGEYAAGGAPIPPPNGGTEMQGTA